MIRPAEPPACAEHAGLQRGSEALRKAIAAEVAEQAQRRSIARTLSGSAMAALTLPRPAAPRAIAIRTFPKAPAANREPCPRCATRGDLGCAHRAPAEQPAEMPAETLAERSPDNA